MITKQQMTHYLSNLQPNNISNDCIEITNQYLTELGKDSNYQLCLQMAHYNPTRFLVGRQKAIDHYIEKLGILYWIYNKENKLIKII